jgi:hypothetical protein
MFGNLIGVVLGSTHPLTVAFHDFWALLHTNVREYLHAALEYKVHVKPTHILCSLQLIFYQGSPTNLPISPHPHLL